MLCACSSRSALHFDLGVEQACSAAARVLLASPSRAPPSSASSCLAFFPLRGVPSCRGAPPADPHFLWVRSPFFGSYVIFPEIAYARGLPVRGRTDVLSRPRLPVSSRLALHMSALLPVCSAEPLSFGAAGRVFPAATEYDFKSTAG